MTNASELLEILKKYTTCSTCNIDLYHYIAIFAHEWNSKRVNVIDIINYTAVEDVKRANNKSLIHDLSRVHVKVEGWPISFDLERCFAQVHSNNFMKRITDVVGMVSTF